MADAFSTGQLSAKAALGRVEQSLTDIQGSDTMGDLEKILVSAQVCRCRDSRQHGRCLRCVGPTYPTYRSQRHDVTSRRDHMFHRSQ